MAILIDKNTRVLIQGITGMVGSFQTQIMQEYGTKVVAGVTPGKGGQMVHGIPVYDFVSEAVAKHEVNAVFGFVPARFAKDAALEVIDAGIPLLVLTAVGLPDQDMLTIIQYAACKGTTVVGPDTPGVVSPGKCKLGVHPNRVLLAQLYMQPGSYCLSTSEIDMMVDIACAQPLRLETVTIERYVPRDLHEEFPQALELKRRQASASDLRDFPVPHETSPSHGA